MAKSPRQINGNSSRVRGSTHNTLSKPTTLIRIMSEYSNTIQKFPTETLEAIIDQAYTLKPKGSDFTVSRTKLLRVFSLVSKSWLPRSRYYLFQKLKLGHTRTGAKPFLDVVDSPLCSFKPYVQILVLDQTLYRDPMWLEEALPRLSVLLPAVRELWIRGGTFPNTVTFLSDFINLQILVLESCYFDSHAQLFEILSMCKSLKKIGFDRSMICRYSDSSPAVFNCPPPASLRDIQIHSAVSTVSNTDVMEWLVSGEQVPAIETLELSIIGKEESRGIGHGLRKFGPCLKSLEVRFTFDTSIQNAFLRDVDLRYNTNLNSICLRFGPASVASLLAQVTSSEVREVVVDVGRAFQRLSQVDWDTIARILDQPNFSKLERLIIPGVWRDVESDGVRQWMMQRLLPGRARDKLILCEQFDKRA